ncbi:NYN domain-containing protein [Fusibacter sp. JL298sf-3]
MKQDKKIAVLIDADNVSEKYIKLIFDELSSIGVPTYKRIYGDWTKPQLSSWKGVLLDYSITPIQQYSYTTGKNATDASLIIDAMDILYSSNVDGFCIVSSDSDFTRLASRLREAGMTVIGMGERKTPKAFISACEKFKYLDIIGKKPGEIEAEMSSKDDRAGKSGIISRSELIEVINRIISEISDEDGWAFLGEVGSVLNKRYPDFDTRNYGFTKLTPLVSSLKQFEIRSRKTNNKSVSLKYVRSKNHH